jgi:hypothetical protein
VEFSSSGVWSLSPGDLNKLLIINNRYHSVAIIVNEKISFASPYLHSRKDMPFWKVEVYTDAG